MVAWHRAFLDHDIVLPLWRLHRYVGMGGDQYVKAVAGDDVEARLGDDLRDAHDAHFEPLRDECRPLDGARELLEALRERGLGIVLASSSPEDDVLFFLELLGVRDLVDDYTTDDDVARTKPHPDLVRAALEQAGTRDAVLVGDSRWDVEAAANANIDTICVLTGGWSEQELLEAGAASVFDSLVTLCDRLDETPLGRG